MSGVDERDSLLHERRYPRTWLRRHAMVLIALAAILGWLIAGLCYIDRQAKLQLAQEAEARALDAGHEADVWAGVAARYIRRDAEAKAWRPGQPLPAIPGLEAPKR